MVDTGLVKLWGEIYKVKRNISESCSPVMAGVSDRAAVTLEAVQGGFVLLTIGLGVSHIALIAECLIEYKPYWFWHCTKKGNK